MPSHALFCRDVCAAVEAGVAASFVLMLVLARVWLPGTIIVAALLAGGVLYGTLLRDVGPARAGGTAAAGGLLIAVSFVFVSYLAVTALIGAAGVYLVLRLWLRTRPALLVMSGTLVGLLTASAGVFTLALSGM